MTAKLSLKSVIFLDMVAFPDCEKRLALNWSEHSRDQDFHRVLVRRLALTPRFIERYSPRGPIRDVFACLQADS